MLYVGDIGIEIRVNTGQPLTGATLMEIHVLKPSGATETWTATAYDNTWIVYTLVIGDLDEVGEYILQGYVEIGGGKYSGIPTTIDVGQQFEFSEDDMVTPIFRTLYRNIILQTENESANETNTKEENEPMDYIGYEDYRTFYKQAVEELTRLLAQRGITTIGTRQRYAAIAHLIADYYTMGDPDWNYQSETAAPGESFVRGKFTAPRQALIDLLNSIAPVPRSHAYFVKVDPYFYRGIFETDTTVAAFSNRDYP